MKQIQQAWLAILIASMSVFAFVAIVFTLLSYFDALILGIAFGIVAFANGLFFVLFTSPEGVWMTPFIACNSVVIALSTFFYHYDVTQKGWGAGDVTAFNKKWMGLFMGFTWAAVALICIRLLSSIAVLIVHAVIAFENGSSTNAPDFVPPFANIVGYFIFMLIVFNLTCGWRNKVFTGRWSAPEVAE